MPNVRHALGVGGDGHEVLRDGRLVAERGQRPLARGCALVIVSSVVNVFEAMMNSVSLGSRSRVASTMSVESTLETKRSVRSRSRVEAQRLVRHHRARGPSRRSRR